MLYSVQYRLMTSRVVFALFVINKAGGLVYNREFHTGMSKLSSNDYLTLAGSFHGYISPPPPLPPNPPSTPPY